MLSPEEMKPLEDIEKFNKFLNFVPGLNHIEVRDELMAKIGKYFMHFFTWEKERGRSIKN